VLAVIPAVVKPGSSAGGSPIMATLSVPPFLGDLPTARRTLNWAMTGSGAAAVRTAPARAEPVKVGKGGGVRLGKAVLLMFVLLFHLWGREVCFLSCRGERMQLRARGRSLVAIKITRHILPVAPDLAQRWADGGALRHGVRTSGAEAT